MIMFPASGVFLDLGTMGVSMFFVSYVIHPLELASIFDNLCSTFVSQLIYSAGASGFAGANGSMMIEVVVSQTLVHRQ
jgi:sulfate permease, SulP family